MRALYAGRDHIHRMLNRIEWDADEVLDDVRDYVVEHIGHKRHPGCDPLACC